MADWIFDKLPQLTTKGRKNKLQAELHHGLITEHITILSLNDRTGKVQVTIDSPYKYPGGLRISCGDITKEVSFSITERSIGKYWSDSQRTFIHAYRYTHTVTAEDIPASDVSQIKLEYIPVV